MYRIGRDGRGRGGCYINKNLVPTQREGSIGHVGREGVGDIWINKNLVSTQREEGIGYGK